MRTSLLIYVFKNILNIKNHLEFPTHNNEIKFMLIYDSIENKNKNNKHYFVTSIYANQINSI